MSPVASRDMLYPYGQNIRTHLFTGDYTSYHHPHFGLSSAPLSQILIGPMDGKSQIPPDLVVKFYPVDIFEVIRDLMRRLNVVQRLCSNRKSRGELLATSPTHWFTTKLDGM